MRKKWLTCMQDSTLTSSAENGRLAHLCIAANRSPRVVLCIACTVMAAPGLHTGWQALQGELGPNPLESLIRTPGRWSLIWLLAAIAMAPIRHALVAASQCAQWSYGKRLSDWNWFIRMRRQAGLASFFYATIHLSIYISLDVGFVWSELMNDLREKIHIGFGIAAFVLLVPLAVTSTDGWMRRLQRNWKRLHMLVYPAAVISMLHFIFLTKYGVSDPIGYGLVLAVLLTHRFASRWFCGEAQQQERIDGAVPERPAKPAIDQAVGETHHA